MVDDHLHLFPDLFSTMLWRCGVKPGVAQGETTASERKISFLFLPSLSISVEQQRDFAKALETLWLEIKEGKAQRIRRSSNV